MHKNKHCFIIRCKDIGEDEKTLKETLSIIIDINDIFFSTDSDLHDPKKNIFSLRKFIVEENLDIPLKDTAWRCGDFNIYNIRKNKPDYDFYWLIEPDVYVDKIVLKKLLEETKNKNEDLLIHAFNKRDQKWSWFKDYHKFYAGEDVYGGLFSLVRVSKKLSDYLFNRRKKLNSLFNGGSLYPNDESFVCSTAYNSGFKCNELTITKNGKFNLVRKLRTTIKEGQISHPSISTEEQFKEKIKEDLQYIEKSNDLANYLIENIQQNNHSPLVTKLTIDTAINNYKPNVVDSLRDNAFSIKNSHPKKAIDILSIAKKLRTEAPLIQNTINQIIQEKKYNSHQIIYNRKLTRRAINEASINDFELSDTIYTLAKFDNLKFKPYCFEKNHLYYIETKESCYDAPFLYQSQRDSANFIYKKHINELKKESIDINEQRRINFIFSIGRCGSTLISKTYKAIGRKEVSECDVFSQTDNDIIISNTIKSFISDSDKLVNFKFRSVTCKYIKKYIDEYPHAEFTFLYRDVEDWAKSYSGKFNWNTEQLLWTYKIGLDCIEKLIKSNVKINIIKYEDFIKNPYLITSDNDEEVFRKIKKVLSEDSQRDSSIDNNNKTYNKYHVESFIKRNPLTIDELIEKLKNE